MSKDRERRSNTHIMRDSAVGGGKNNGIQLVLTAVQGHMGGSVS